MGSEVKLSVEIDSAFDSRRGVTQGYSRALGHAISLMDGDFQTLPDTQNASRSVGGSSPFGRTLEIDWLQRAHTAAFSIFATLCV